MRDFGTLWGMHARHHGHLQCYPAYTPADTPAGEGWKARGAFFMFLLAPRYVMASSGGIFLPEFNLLYLASNDLPAVGLLNRSQVGGAGAGGEEGGVVQSGRGGAVNMSRCDHPPCHQPLHHTARNPCLTNSALLNRQCFIQKQLPAQEMA